MGDCFSYGGRTYRKNVLFEKIRSKAEFFAKKHAITGFDVEVALGTLKDTTGNVEFHFGALDTPILPKTLIAKVAKVTKDKAADIIRDSDWYQNLSALDQTQVDDQLEDVYAYAKNEIKRHKEKAAQANNPTEQATQARNKNLVTERIKVEKRKPKNAIRNINDIIADVSKGLKATLINAKPLSRRAAGTYNPTNTLIRIRNASDVDTVAHELGHLLDDRFDIYGKITPDNIIPIIRQLKWFSERGGSNPPAKATADQKSEYIQREGIAEFIRAFVFNPEAAKTIAPELYDHFQNSIDKPTRDTLKKFSDDVIDLSNGTARDKITAQVEVDFKGDKKNKVLETLNYWFTKDEIFGWGLFADFNKNILNSLSKADKAFLYINRIQGDRTLLPEKDFTVLNKLFNGVYGKIDRILRTGLVNGRNKLIKDSNGDVMNMEWLFSPLDATSEKSVSDDMREVISLLVAERTVEYVTKFNRTDNLTGIGAGIETDMDVATEYLSDFEELKTSNREKYDRIKEAARRYREYADGVLQYAVDKGRLSKVDYKKIKDSNAFYVNLTRSKEKSATVEDEVEKLLMSSKNITSTGNIFKKAKGGTDRIRNPYESLLMNSANIIKEADRNEIMRSFVDGLRNIRGMGEGTPIDLARIASKGNSSDNNARKIFVDGNMEWWTFSNHIIDAVQAIEGDGFSFHWLAKLPAATIRWTVTHFPVFAARNVTRDTVSRLINSRSVNIGKDGIKGLNLLHSKSDRELFELYGGSMGGHMVDRDMYKKHIAEATEKMLDNGHFVLHPKNWGQTV